MNKEALRKLLEDCWDAGYDYRTSLLPEIIEQLGENKMPSRATFITSQLSAMEQGEGMRWVKASERLPDWGIKFIKVGEVKLLAEKTKNEKHFIDLDGNKIALSRVLWLDESPSDGQDWISVDDRLPENGQRIFFCDKKDVYVGDCFKHHAIIHTVFTGLKISNTYDEMLVRENITHWMPLPKPPSQ